VLAGILKANGHDLAYNVLDIGAAPLAGETEPYHRLFDAFPSARLTGFEIDPRMCAELNNKAPAGVRYYPCALGRADENRRLYDAVHPMCTSLYPPDERFADLFGALDEMRLKGTSEITTMTLDRFARDHALGAVDFVKIDVQGAELEIFQGGLDALRDVLFIVCEVEFVALYRGQPLFGDVDSWLRARGMMFHKFLGMAGRVMKPMTVNGRTDYPAQFMWADAVFVRDPFALQALSAEQLLKLAVLFDLYDSKDAALHVLRRYDARDDDDLGDVYLQHLPAGGVWSTEQRGEAGES
jgi:FkbM family methyltransferase